MFRRTFTVARASSAKHGHHQAVQHHHHNTMPHNRIVLVCTSLNESDEPQWPKWLWEQMSHVKGVTDFAMMAVTREESFLARIDGDKKTCEPLPVPVSGKAKKKGKSTHHHSVDRKQLTSFLDEHHKPGHTWFVYGGHGVSDHLEFREWDDVMQMHELAQAFQGKRYEGMLFDACLQSSLDTAFYLRHNTRYIGAAAGYNWEDMTRRKAVPTWMFQPLAASAMSRFRDPLKILTLVGNEYTRKSDNADYAILDTSYAEPLWWHVQNNYMRRWIEEAPIKQEVLEGEKPIFTNEVRSRHDRDFARALKVKRKAKPLFSDLPTVSLPSGDTITRTFEHRNNFDFTQTSFVEGDDEDLYVHDLKRMMDDNDTVGHEMLRRVLVKYTPARNEKELYSHPLCGLNCALSHWNEESHPLTREQSAHADAHLKAAARRYERTARRSLETSKSVTTMHQQQTTTVHSSASPLIQTPTATPVESVLHNKSNKIVPSAAPSAFPPRSTTTTTTTTTTSSSKINVTISTSATTEEAIKVTIPAPQRSQ